MPRYFSAVLTMKLSGSSTAPGWRRTAVALDERPAREGVEDGHDADGPVGGARNRAVGVLGLVAEDGRRLDADEAPQCVQQRDAEPAGEARTG